MKKRTGAIFVVAILILCLVVFSAQTKTSQTTDSYNAAGITHSKVTPDASSSSARKRALTAEEAKKLRGTGYHGTRPNSSAENSEIKAAQNKCSNCGHHTEYGSNSICQYCRDQGIR